MNLVSQLQTHYGWTPSFRQVYKKPVPPGCKTFTVPQTTGDSGWLIFTMYNNNPVCLWASTHDCCIVPCSVDERICGDTFMRVERISSLEFVVSDIWMYNSNCVFACSTFSQRYIWLKGFLSKCIGTVPGCLKVIHKSELSNSIRIKGYETYIEGSPGKPGYFTDSIRETQLIKKLGIPDCYEVLPSKGYLSVPDFKTSAWLRKQGPQFECECVPNEDGFWTIVENIPELE